MWTWNYSSAPLAKMSFGLQIVLTIHFMLFASSSAGVQVQLAELIDCLDKQYWEADLYAVLEEMREEIHVHMDITEDLTNKARGSNKCFLTAANGEEARSHTLSRSHLAG